jgi:O-antigen/teichoic acid export membrane protein
VPTIASRFLGYLMNLSLPLIFSQPATTAELTQVYAIIPFLNVLFTYGLETAYFRFSQDTDREKLYDTLSLSLIGSTILFTTVLFLFKDTIASWAGLEDQPSFTGMMAAIIFFDAVSTLAFAKLRQENRPKRYAFARLSGVLLNVIVVIFFLGILPKYLAGHPGSWLQKIYNKDTGIEYYLVGNLAGSILTFILLRKEFGKIHFRFDGAIWKKVMHYSYPLVFVGMGGVVNDMLSRLIYQHVVDLPKAQAEHELGIFGNIIRLAILITVTIQAFRMAAEPFFFNRSKEENPQRIYARVMKFFVIVCCFLFLGISLYLDLVKWFFLAIHREKWTEGLYVVPLFAMANIMLGIYYNLSIWYKLKHKNMIGAWITLAGAVITIALNILLIPKFHYLGAAIATFFCYLFMMITSYIMGQKHYPVPYAKKKLIAYLVLVSLIYAAHRGLVYVWDNRWFNIGTATVFFLFFTWFVLRIERNELLKIPVLARFVPGKRTN